MGHKVTIILEKGEDGSYSAYPENLKTTIIGEGRSAEEAKEDFSNSFNEIISYYQEEGKPIPHELINVDFEYKFDLSSFFNYFDFINVSKFSKTIGIEPSLMRHYKQGKTSISAKQKKKIESGIHSLAVELGQIAL